MIYEVVEVLSQRPAESAPIFDAVVETLGWDPIPGPANETASAESTTAESAEKPESDSTEKLTVESAEKVKVDVVKKSAAELVGKPTAAPPELPDTSQPRPRVRKPRPRQESDPRTAQLSR